MPGILRVLRLGLGAVLVGLVDLDHRVPDDEAGEDHHDHGERDQAPGLRPADGDRRRRLAPGPATPAGPAGGGGVLLPGVVFFFGRHPGALALRVNDGPHGTGAGFGVTRDRPRCGGRPGAGTRPKHVRFAGGLSSIVRVTPEELAAAVRLPSAPRSTPVSWPYPSPTSVGRRAAEVPRARRLRHQRRAAAGQGGRPAAARDRRGWSPRELRGHAGHRERRRRRPGLPQHHAWPRPRWARWSRTIVAAGRGYGARRRAAPAAASTWSSSRPTRPGPLHIGGARWAAVGDALGRVLAAQGAKVVREYYFNDAGAQIDRFARSLLAAARGRAGARGRLRRRLHRRDRRARSSPPHPEALGPARRRARPRSSGASGVELMFDEIKATLHAFRTDFDVWFHENSLHESGAVDRGRGAAEGVRARCTTPTAPGGCAPPTTATTRTGCVIKSDGDPAYIAGDLRLLPGQAAPAASTCASTCSAPTTTATSPGCKAIAAALRRRPGGASRC